MEFSVVPFLPLDVVKNFVVWPQNMILLSAVFLLFIFSPNANLDLITSFGCPSIDVTKIPKWRRVGILSQKRPKFCPIILSTKLFFPLFKTSCVIYTLLFCFEKTT